MTHQPEGLTMYKIISTIAAALIAEWAYAAIKKRIAARSAR